MYVGIKKDEQVHPFAAAQIFPPAPESKTPPKLLIPVLKPKSN